MIMRFMRSIAAALALTIGAASLVGTAEAGYRHHHHHNGAGIAAAGIFGLAAGALIGSALSQPRYYDYYQPAPVYVEPPPPVVYQTAPVYYARPDPWSPEWYSYCSQRYRSFNPQTGYFLGYDGNYHFCD
jgi:hypothetical protein